MFWTSDPLIFLDVYDYMRKMGYDVLVKNPDWLIISYEIRNKAGWIQLFFAEQDNGRHWIECEIDTKGDRTIVRRIVNDLIDRYMVEKDSPS